MTFNFIIGQKERNSILVKYRHGIRIYIMGTKQKESLKKQRSTKYTNKKKCWNIVSANVSVNIVCAFITKNILNSSSFRSRKYIWLRILFF